MAERLGFTVEDGRSYTEQILLAFLGMHEDSDFNGFTHGLLMGQLSTMGAHEGDKIRKILLYLNTKRILTFVRDEHQFYTWNLSDDAVERLCTEEDGLHHIINEVFGESINKNVEKPFIPQEPGEHREITFADIWGDVADRIINNRGGYLLMLRRYNEPKIVDGKVEIAEIDPTGVQLFVADTLEELLWLVKHNPREYRTSPDEQSVAQGALQDMFKEPQRGSMVRGVSGYSDEQVGRRTGLMPQGFEAEIFSLGKGGLQFRKTGEVHTPSGEEREALFQRIMNVVIANELGVDVATYPADQIIRAVFAERGRRK